MNLTFERSYPGKYVAETQGATEFRAVIYRTSDGDWIMSTSTFGLPMTVETYPTLAAAKAYAVREFYAVETGASA